jgi:nitrogen-specific signal transduction histidine kinase
VKQTIERASLDGEDFDREYRLVMPDGSVKYVHVVAHALSDESGGIDFVGAMTDTTESKRAAEAQADLAHVSRVTIMGELTASLAHEVKQPIARCRHQRQHLLAVAGGRDPQYRRGARGCNENRQRRKACRGNHQPGSPAFRERYSATGID